MSGSAAPRLPRGRHGLSRAEVQQSQRDRMLTAITEAMSEKGYTRTVVEDVIKRAGVSREAFYQLYSSKHDCFMAAFARAAELLTAHLARADQPVGPPIDRFARLLGAYLDFLAAQPTLARLFLIEAHAAGAAAIEARLAVQRALADGIAEIFAARSERQRFACQTIVSATAAMLTGPLVNGDPGALRAIGPRMIQHVRDLADAGLLGPGPGSPGEPPAN